MTEELVYRTVEHVLTVILHGIVVNDIFVVGGGGALAMLSSDLQSRDIVGGRRRGFLLENGHTVDRQKCFAVIRDTSSKSPTNSNSKENYH